MRTTFDIVDIIYPILKNDAALTTALSGTVYKDGQRPIGSGKEDVSIGSLPVNGEQLQQTVVNVNIHVPNQKLLLNDVQDNTKPDLKRLKALTALVIGLVNEKYYSDYWFFVQQQQLFPEQDENANEHYSNIRLSFYSENIN